MKATLPDGRTLSGPFETLCTGYVADKIEIDHADANAMLGLLRLGRLEPYLMQLAARFPENRIGGKKQ